MLQITPQHRLLLAVEPADFRSGIDGIAALCRLTLQADPFTGTVFVFSNKRRTSVKILIYDGTGFWLAQKRFSKGTLKWWPSCSAEAATITARELQLLLHQGDPSQAKFAEEWRKVNSNQKSLT
jgi:transposase